MMHQHFNVEVFTDCVKTTSLFKTAPLKSLKVHPRFVLSPKIIIYVLTFPLMYCPMQPILQRHRRAPALPSSPVTIRGPARSALGADSQKKRKKPNNHMTAWLLHPEGTWRANNTESLCDHRDQRIQRSIHLRAMETAHAQLRRAGGGVPFRTIELQT